MSQQPAASGGNGGRQGGKPRKSSGSNQGHHPQQQQQQQQQQQPQQQPQHHQQHHQHPQQHPQQQHFMQQRGPPMQGGQQPHQHRGRPMHHGQMHPGAQFSPAGGPMAAPMYYNPYMMHQQQFMMRQPFPPYAPPAGAAGGSPGGPTPTSTPPAVVPPQPRKKKVLAIIDPKTGKPLEFKPVAKKSPATSEGSTPTHASPSPAAANPSPAPPGGVTSDGKAVPVPQKRESKALPIMDTNGSQVKVAPVVSKPAAVANNGPAQPQPVTQKQATQPRAGPPVPAPRAQGNTPPGPAPISQKAASTASAARQPAETASSTRKVSERNTAVEPETVVEGEAPVEAEPDDVDERAVGSDNDMADLRHDDDDDDDDEEFNFDEEMEEEKSKFTIEELLALRDLPYSKNQPHWAKIVPDLIPGMARSNNRGGGGGRGRYNNNNRQQGGGRYDDRQQGGRYDRHGGRDNRRGGRDRRDNRRHGGGRGRHSGGRGRHHNNQYQEPMDIGEIQPLKRSESGYRVGATNTDDEREILRKNVQAILNKLTLEKFEKLSKQLIELIEENVEDSTDLVEVVVLIFDKSLGEAYFAEMYAKLCALLDHELEAVPDAQSKTVTDTTFKRLLLNQCQTEFEKGSVVIDKTGLSAEEATMQERKQKTRMLGNIRFIGELYVQNMISDKIINNCLRHLLGGANAKPSTPGEEDVESFCKLIATIGHKFDTQQSQRRMKWYMGFLKALSKEKRLSSRARFMCMDILDLRRNKWRARIKKEKARTLAEIRAEEAKKQQQKNNRRGGGRSGGGRRDDRRDDRRGDRRDNRGGDVRNNKPRGGGGSRDGGSRDFRNKGDSRGGDRGGNRYAQYSSGADAGPPSRTSRSPGRGGSSSSRGGHGFGPGARGGSSSGRPRFTNRTGGAGPQPVQRKPEEEEEDDNAPEVEAEDEHAADQAMIKKISAFVKEYINAKDINEVKLCISDLKIEDKKHLVVRATFLTLLNEKSTLHEPLFKCIVEFLEKGVLSSDDVDNGVGAMLEPMLDIAIDVNANAPVLIGDFCGRLAAAGHSKLAFFSHTDMKMLVGGRLAQKMLGAVVTALVKAADADKAKEMILATGVPPASLLRMTPEEFATKFQCPWLF